MISIGKLKKELSSRNTGTINKGALTSTGGAAETTQSINIFNWK